ncbi:condensation domain-containing protein [Micromonospora sp. NBC_00421]|uniref:condensation domain-containing protein n=1 Tax=Micromonospora sp. NBC_00421 TaxID=2975976 RepID=UPI002E21F9ED
MLDSTPDHDAAPIREGATDQQTGAGYAVAASFSGARGETAPLTWGQQGIWDAIQRNAPGHFNVGTVVAVPPGLKQDARTIAAAIGRLLDRHESLRTRILAVDGEYRQAVERSGALRVEVVEAGGSGIHAVAHRLRSMAYDYARGDLPLRVALVTRGGAIEHVLLTLCHSAADLQGLSVVREDLAKLLEGAELPGQVPQPVDLARNQLLPAARRRSARSVEYWTRQIGRVRSSMFTEAEPPQTPAFRSALLTSPAVGAAARLLAARHGVGESTVLQAACVCVLTSWTGQHRCHLQSLTSNRFWPGHQGMVTHMCQQGLFVLDVSAAWTFDDLLSATDRAAAEAHWHAYYRQRDLDAAVERLQAEDGVVQRDCYFNDTRSDGPPVWTAASQPQEDELVVSTSADSAVAVPADSTDVRRLAAETSFRWQADPGWLQCRFSLKIFGPPAVPRVSLSADTRYLPAARIEQFLADFEGCLVRASEDSRTMAVVR